MTTTNATQMSSSVVPASTTTAFPKEGLTSCPQALSSAQSVPTLSILIAVIKQIKDRFYKDGDEKNVIIS